MFTRVAPAKGVRARTAHRIPRPGLRRRHEPDLDRGLLARPQDRQRHLALRALQGEAVAEGIRVIDGLSVHQQNDVAPLEAGFGGRSLIVDRRHEDAGRALQAETVGDIAVHGLKARAEPGPRSRSWQPPRAEFSTTRTMLDGTAKPMPMLPPERE